MGSGARKAASVPGGTTTRPSGLRMSEATFATSFEVATPTEAVRWVSLRTASFSRAATVSPSPNARRLPVTSRNASSIETGSTQSLKRPRTSITWRETAAYLSMSGWRYTPCGHRFQAWEIGIALDTPKARAS